MILAEKRVFETHFASENFSIHKKMLTYYQAGMQGTTIASLATIHMMYSDIMRNNAQHVESNYYKMFLVYALCVMGIMCALMNAVLSTTVKIFGGASLLCEADNDEVVQIILGVRRKQEECARWWLAALLLIGLQGAAWAWDSGNWPVLAAETFVNVCALGLALHQARKTMRIFSPDSNDSGPLVFKTSLFAQYGGDMKSDQRRAKIQVLRSASSSLGADHSHLNREEIEKALSKLRGEQRLRLKAASWRGSLWFRDMQHQQRHEGVFRRAYVVLDTGSLYFYKDKDEFLHFTSTLEKNKCLKLLDFELESNAKRVADMSERRLSVHKALRAAVFGSDDLSFADMLGADFDVSAAVASYKFCLLPKQNSELSVHEPVFLMAEDKKNWAECLSALRESMQAYEELQAAFSVNRGARLVNDPKAALAFLHDRGTARQMEATEKAHARQVQGQLKVQEQHRAAQVTRDVEDGHDQSMAGSQFGLASLTAGMRGESSEYKENGGDASGYSMSGSRALNSLGKSLSMRGGGMVGGNLDKKALALERQLQIRARLKTIEGRGALWTKSVDPVRAPRSFLTERYAVLDNGKLHFYRNKDDFLELGDALAEPLSLRDFKLSEDRSTLTKVDVKSNNFSIMRHVRQALNDSHEIRSRDRLGIDFDYRVAVSNFKFCLKPTSKRAIRSGFFGIVLMAENKASFNHWLSLLRAAADCLGELDALASSADFQEAVQVSLTLDAEELVQRSNHKIKHQVDLT